jgi:hypothetical protein
LAVIDEEDQLQEVSYEQEDSLPPDEVQIPDSDGEIHSGEEGMK